MPKKLLSNEWSNDIQLTNNSTTDKYYIDIDFNYPTVHIVYQESFDFGPNWDAIRYMRSTDCGKTWEPFVDLSGNNTFCPIYPQIAINNENVYVVWQDWRGTADEVYFIYSLDNGMNWSNDTALTSNDGKMSKEPCIAVNGSVIHVVWVDERSGDDYYELFYQRSIDGGVTWDDGLGNIGNVTQLTSCVPPLADYLPNIAVYGDSIHVTWTQYAGEILVKYMKSDDNGAHWTEPTTLSTTGDGHSETSNIAVSGSNVHVVWEEEKDGNTEIYYRNSSDNGDSFNSEIRLTDTSAEEYDPHITVNGSWVWVSWWNDGDHCGYYRLSKDNGTTWEDPVQLTTQSGTPILAVSDGYVHAVFTSDRTGNNEIYYKRYPKFNDPPEINYCYPETNVTITETQTQLFSVNASDPDNDTLTYLWYLNDTPLTDEINSSYTFIPEENFSGNYSVKVSVSDGEYFANRTWIVTVINVGQLQETATELQIQIIQLNENYTQLLETLTQFGENLSLIWFQLNETDLNNTELWGVVEQLRDTISILYNQLNSSILNNTELQNAISNLTQNLSSSNEQIAILQGLLNQSLTNQTELKIQIIQLNETIGSLQEQIDNLKKENELIAEERDVAEERLMVAVILLIIMSLACALVMISRRKK